MSLQHEPVFKELCVRVVAKSFYPNFKLKSRYGSCINIIKIKK